MTDSTITIAALITVIGFIGTVITIISFVITRKKAGYDNGQYDGVIKGRLEYIGKGVDDIRLDIKELMRKQNAQDSRITKLEEQTKFNAERITQLENAMAKYHK